MDDIPFVFIVTKNKDNVDAVSAASAADAEKENDSWYNRRQIVDDIISSLTSMHPGIHGSIVESIPKSSRGGPDRAYLRLKLASDHC
ncbi:hypothetical protein LPJ73_006474 [Coemansia sp. RSA 2703]|nr:hypothetical protein LPJ73_006474 [Coemansia sp. RSA 2703]